MHEYAHLTLFSMGIARYLEEANSIQSVAIATEEMICEIINHDKFFVNEKFILKTLNDNGNKLIKQKLNKNKRRKKK